MSANRTDRHAALALAEQLDQREGLHRVNTLDRVLRGNAFEPHRPRRSRRPLARLWRGLLTYLAQPSPFRRR